jgi:hypothetical protein
VPVTTETVMPKARLYSVACNLHPRPLPDGCNRCKDAYLISLRLEHERGECYGIGWCTWCTPPDWKPGT